MMKFRSPYDYDTDAASVEAAVVFVGPSRTQQSHAQNCDINYIMKRFGQVPNMPENFAMPRYGDFTGLDDYQSAIGYVRASGEAFMALPADLRARFHNDPSEILAFMDVEANRAEAIELGLLPKEAAADRAAAPAPVVPSSGGDEGASSAPLTQSTT